MGLLPVDKLDSDFPAADYLLASPHHRVAPSSHLDTDYDKDINIDRHKRFISANLEICPGLSVMIVL